MVFDAKMAFSRDSILILEPQEPLIWIGCTVHCLANNVLENPELFRFRQAPLKNHYRNESGRKTSLKSGVSSWWSSSLCFPLRTKWTSGKRAPLISPTNDDAETDRKLRGGTGNQKSFICQPRSAFQILKRSLIFFSIYWTWRSTCYNKYSRNHS